MTSEVPATPVPAAEPATEQPTPPVQAEAVPAPEQPKPEPPKETDWRAAYVGNQTNLNKLHARVDNLLEQNKGLAAAITSMKSGQNELVKATLGDDKAREMAARDAQNMAQEAARRAATAAQTLLETQAGLLLDALSAYGIDPKDPEIDWAQDAGLDVQQWGQRVGASVKAKIQKVTEQRLAKERETITAKSRAEIKAEAEALTDRTLKASGVDRIDTGKGQASTDLIERIRNLKPGTPEYRKFEADVASGRLK